MWLGVCEQPLDETSIQDWSFRENNCGFDRGMKVFHDFYCFIFFRKLSTTGRNHVVARGMALCAA